LDCLTHEGGSNRSSHNSSNKLPFYAV